ncbi:hypothetical protein NDU88_000084 [Pleurodeles waltl]|uniref:Peptidase A2 domain-containing protein n=1 Tax=Pleurodeles waltl TaxID=8319 RepID=A0AAV7S6K0_PLEWA|nr:hypothetical protein NDU88_000084 [Pleurodeles waltl]
MYSGEARRFSESTLVSLRGVDIEVLSALPPSLEKYRQNTKINGTELEALRDTGASVTMVAARLVPPDQMIPGVRHQVTSVDKVTKLHPVALVSLEWGGVTGPKKEVVSPATPLEGLLVYDLEMSPWTEVERLMQKCWVSLSGPTRAQTAQQRRQEEVA